MCKCLCVGCRDHRLLMVVCSGLEDSRFRWEGFFFLFLFCRLNGTKFLPTCLHLRFCRPEFVFCFFSLFLFLSLRWDVACSTNAGQAEVNGLNWMTAREPREPPLGSLAVMRSPPAGHITELHFFPTRFYPVPGLSCLTWHFHSYFLALDNCRHQQCFVAICRL